MAPRQAGVLRRTVSFLTAEFGYTRSLRRFRQGGFQLGYLGPGAGVLLEWYPRDGVMVWLLPIAPGEIPDWSGAGAPRRFDLGLVATAGRGPDLSDWDIYGLTDDAITALAGQLRSGGQDMLRGDYSRFPASLSRSARQLGQALAIGRSTDFCGGGGIYTRPPAVLG